MCLVKITQQTTVNPLKVGTTTFWLCHHLRYVIQVLCHVYELEMFKICYIVKHWCHGVRYVHYEGIKHQTSTENLLQENSQIFVGW